jgi:lysozyme
MSRLAGILAVGLPIALALYACTAGPRVIPTAFTPGILLEPQRPGDLGGPPPRKITDDGLKITKDSEGFSSHLYLDAAHYCSIAYGHLVWRRPCNGTEPESFRKGLSIPEGEALLTADMLRAQRAIEQILTTSQELTDNQFSALCDFVYNVGGDHFRTSTLHSVLEARQFEQIPFQLRQWVWAGGKRYKGLAQRREREIALFFKGSAVPKPRPGDTVSKEIDITVGELYGPT